ncbi:rhomboid family intramembrane serine protease [Candidatus Harpocratesius sp.]
MVKCDVPDCDEILDYLPFKCRYCGGTFCKKHRLPENHNCSFKMTVKPERSYTSSSIPGQKNTSGYLNNVETPFEGDETQLDREMRDYIRNQERSAMPPAPSRDSRRVRSFSRPLFGVSQNTKGTYWLMGLNGFFSIAALLIALFESNSTYFLLNFQTLFGKFWIWSIFTSMFTTISIFSLLFVMIILFGTGRMLEKQFGTRFILYLYIGCGLFGIVGGILFQLIFSFIPFLSPNVSQAFQLSFFSVQWAALIGMISFILYLAGLNREMRMYLYFIPVKMKGKYLLYFLIGMDLIIIILGLFNPTFSGSAIESFAQLSALAGGYYFYKKFGSQFAISRFI